MDGKEIGLKDEKRKKQQVVEKKEEEKRRGKSRIGQKRGEEV